MIDLDMKTDSSVRCMVVNGTDLYEIRTGQPGTGQVVSGRSGGLATSNFVLRPAPTSGDEDGIWWEYWGLEEFFFWRRHSAECLQLLWGWQDGGIFGVVVWLSVYSFVAVRGVLMDARCVQIFANITQFWVRLFCVVSECLFWGVGIWGVFRRFSTRSSKVFLFLTWSFNILNFWLTLVNVYARLLEVEFKNQTKATLRSTVAQLWGVEWVQEWIEIIILKPNCLQLLRRELGSDFEELAENILWGV